MAAPAWVSNGTVTAGATRTNTTVTAPATTAINDILIVSMYLEITATPTPPTGWTEIAGSTYPPNGTYASHPIVLRHWWKRLTATENSASYTFTHASNWTRGYVSRFTGAVTTGTPIQTLDAQVRSTAATATPAVGGTTDTAEQLLIWTGMSGDGNGTWTPPTAYAFTERIDSGELTFATFATTTSGVAYSNITGTYTTNSGEGATLLGLRSVAVASGLTIAPTGKASSAAYGTRVVTTGPKPAPTGKASSAAYGAPTVAGGATIAPTGVGDMDMFGSPTVAPAQSLATTGIPSTNAIPTPAVTRGAPERQTPLTSLLARFRADSAAVASGAEVTSLPRKEGTGSNAVATAGQAPTRVDNALNGKPVLRFDGVDDKMDVGGNTAQGQPTTFAVVFKPTTAAGKQIVHFGGEVLYDSNQNIFVWAGAGSNTAAGSTPVNAWYVLIISFVANGVSIYQNGTYLGTADNVGGTGVNADWQIGYHPSISRFFSGDIAEMWVYNRALGTDERATLDSYAQDRYGIQVSDYVADANTTTRVNLVPNPSFEANITDGNTPYSSPTITRDTTNSVIGNASLKQVSPAGSDQGTIIDFGVLPAGDYIASVWMKTENVDNNAAFVVRRIDTYATMGPEHHVTGTTAWTRKSIPFTAPGNTSTHIVIGIGGYGASSGGTVWFDGFLLERGSTLRGYFDGGYSANPNSTTSWTGATNNSASREVTPNEEVHTTAATALAKASASAVTAKVTTTAGSTATAKASASGVSGKTATGVATALAKASASSTSTKTAITSGSAPAKASATYAVATTHTSARTATARAFGTSTSSASKATSATAPARASASAVDASTRTAANTASARAAGTATTSGTKNTSATATAKASATSTSGGTRSVTGTATAKATATSASAKTGVSAATAAARASATEAHASTRTGAATATARATASGTASATRTTAGATAAARATASATSGGVRYTARTAASVASGYASTSTTRSCANTATARANATWFHSSSRYSAQTATAKASASSTSKQEEVHYSSGVAIAKVSATSTTTSVRTDARTATAKASATEAHTTVRTRTGTATARAFGAATTATTRVHARTATARALATWTHTTVRTQARTATARAFGAETHASVRTDARTATARALATSATTKTGTSATTATARAYGSGVQATTRNAAQTASCRATGSGTQSSVRIKTGTASARAAATGATASVKNSAATAQARATALSSNATIRVKTGSAPARAAASAVSRAVKQTARTAVARAYATGTTASLKPTTATAVARAAADAFWATQRATAGTAVAYASASAVSTRFSTTIVMTAYAPYLRWLGPIVGVRFPTGSDHFFGEVYVTHDIWFGEAYLEDEPFGNPTFHPKYLPTGGS